MKLRTKLIVALVAVAVAVLALALFVKITLNNSGILNGNLGGASGLGAVSLHLILNSSTSVTYNDSHKLAAQAVVSYTTSNAMSAAIDMSVYMKNPIQKIYLVNTSGYCVYCFDENDLLAALMQALGRYDLVRNSSSLNYVNISEIGSIPDDSIVIIPSGLMPLPLLAPGIQSSIYGMLDKGDTVIYTGKDFSYVIGPGRLTLVSPQNVTSQLSRYGISTVPTSSYRMQPGNFSFNKPTFEFARGGTLGNATYVNASRGMLIAFSNYPTDSWNNTSEMASDIAKLVNTRIWISKLAEGTEIVSSGSIAAGNLGIFARLSGMDATIAESILNSTYSLVTMTASNTRYSSTEEMVFRNRYKSTGVLGALDVAGEGQQVPLLIAINNRTEQTLMHIDIYDKNLSYISTIPIGFISSSFGVVLKYHTFMLPTGYYVLTLKDSNNNVYASSFFFQANTLITPIKTDFKNGTFAFTAYSNGLPVSNATYSIDLEGAYNSTGTVTQNGVITYAVPKGTVIGYGIKTFNIEIFNTKYPIPINNPIITPTPIPPIEIEFAIAIVVVVLLNLILRPPKRDEYYIDVPEFPPSKKEKVTVQRSSMMGVFDKVNYYYHWRYMPLTVEEIRLGINNNIRVNNMPVSITTQNANTVLAQLVADSYLVNSESYYAPKVWLDTSKHDMEYLVIFRKIRDYCVSHATLFTDLDADENVDMIITKEGKQASILIYSNLSKMKKMEVSRDSRIFIVFLDEETRIGFMDKLYEAYGNEAEALKLGIDYNYIRLIDCQGLDQIVI